MRPETRLKILFISPRYDVSIGGHAAAVARKLCENGFDVRLMKIPHIPIKNIKNPSFAVLSTLRSLISTEEYDIVHGFNLPSAFPMKYTKAKKRVLSVHGVYSEQVGAIHSGTIASVVTNFEPRILGWADRLVTDSKAVQHQYKEKLGVDFECMYTPLIIEQFEEIPDIPKKKDQVVYVGRDSYEKGIDILKKIEPDINGNVVYCTDVDWKEAMTRLKESSLMVIPSRMESNPQVIKEAFYLGVPVVATNVGGVAEVITHDRDGFLVPPEDEARLLDATNKVLADEKTRERFVQNGHDLVMRNFTWKTLLPKYLKFYNDLADS